jgi:hypothetical protein
MRSRKSFSGIGGLSLAMTLVVLAVVLAPESANANLAEGHPEAYSNGVRMTTSKGGFAGRGTIHWVSEALGANIECVQVLWGFQHNEGTPAFGQGQILGWTAQGDATIAGAEPRPSCKFTKTGLEGEPEAWITDEPALEAGHRVPLSVPWNIRDVCSEEESTKRALVRIGVPSGAPPPTVGCATQPERTAEIEKEEAARVGCYAEVVPEGCVKLTWLVPSLGLETTFEGSEQPRWQNGLGSPAHFSDWQFLEGTSKLHLHGAFSTTADFPTAPGGGGQADVTGFSQQLLWAK